SQTLRQSCRGCSLVGAITTPSYAAENNTVKIALVGCGGRGSGAAANELSNWLNGSFIVDWPIHNLHVCCWVRNGWPISAQAWADARCRTQSEKLPRGGIELSAIPRCTKLYVLQPTLCVSTQRTAYSISSE